MSDQTPASGEPEEDEDGPVRPRHQSAAERRSSETVMLDSGSLEDMVSQAKSEAAPAAADPAPTAAPVSANAAEEERERRSVILIVGVAVIIVLAGVIAYLIYKY